MLAECNDKGMPFESFQTEWCARCLTLECTRSIAGKSKFDVRVSTWEETLFLNPPRMPIEDPRYPTISAQKFVTIDVGRTPEVQGWVDPRELEEPQALPPLTDLTSQASSDGLVVTPQNYTASQPSRSTSSRQPLVNTPDQSGKMLPVPPSVSISKRDPWAAPAPPNPADQVVSPGATIKFGGSGT